MPRVSVIIPTYDRADVLGRAVDSVLAQTLDDLELVVVDDGSTDDTQRLLAAYDDDRLTVHRHDENRGGSAARNTGIEHATGEYVAFLDSDDAWHPRKLETQVATLDRRGDDWVAVYCDAEFVTGSRNPLHAVAARLADHVGGPDPPAEGGEELVKHVLADDLHTSAGSTLLVRRETVEAIGGFDESFERFQDPEFLVRVLRRGKLAYVPEALVERYESADPPPDVVAAADQHYLETYRDAVEELEAAGHDIVGPHRLAVARAYLQAGRFRTGLTYLAAAHRPHLHEVPGIAYSALAGLRRRATPN